MDKYRQQAADNRPLGFVQVRSGRILPSDLVWSIYTHEWLRHDDPRWDSTCEYVGQACYVLRADTVKPKEKAPETVDLERVDSKPQPSLFDLLSAL